MVQSPVRLRVHFAALGPQVQRITEPMKMLRADVGILFTFSTTDRSQLFLPKVVEALESSHISVKTVTCNISETSEVVNEIGGIVTAAPRHEYFFNVSTGTINASIAGTIAGMFWKVRPYFIDVDEYKKPIHSEQDFPIIGLPKFIPTFEVPVLEKQSFYALEFLVSKGRSCHKREVLSYLEENGVIGTKAGKSDSDQALQGQLNSIIYRLLTWGFVELTDHGKRLKITVTEKGIEGRKMFFHILHPSELPDILI